MTRPRRVELHHPDQVWWPELGLTKRDAFAYYDAIAPTVLPHLRDRPFTIKQHYNGPRSPFRWPGSPVCCCPAANADRYRSPAHWSGAG